MRVQAIKKATDQSLVIDVVGDKLLNQSFFRCGKHHLSQSYFESIPVRERIVRASSRKDASASSL